MGEFSAPPAGSGDMSAEPPLYLYKQFIVVLVLTAAGVVLAAPFTPHGGILWYLVVFTSINLFNGLGQMARMVDALRKLRARAIPRPPGAASLKALPAAADAKGLPPASPEPEGAHLLHVEDVPAWHHVFVIPNYKEELAVLCATLDRLASHRHASHYTILLAMEEKEAYAEQKAAQLQEQYCLRFKAILFTLHSLDPVHEMPGKASNVNAAVRQFSATIPPSERSRYMLTIMDADALVPPAYVAQIEATTASIGPGAEGNIYAAPVLFEQNGAAVPSLVRVTDYTWGALAMQNLNNWSGTGFPISNYSLSLALAASVDYWDTWWAAAGAGGGGGAAASFGLLRQGGGQAAAAAAGVRGGGDGRRPGGRRRPHGTRPRAARGPGRMEAPRAPGDSPRPPPPPLPRSRPDAIGEDMHMFIKAYSKTRGAARLYPIFAPINMGHINADGFLASCVARYTQVRHGARVAARAASGASKQWEGGGGGPAAAGLDQRPLGPSAASRSAPCRPAAAAPQQPGRPPAAPRLLTPLPSPPHPHPQTIQAERHMRGIADTAYAMREVARRNMPLNLRTACLVWGCWEAHLVSTVSLMSFIFLPMLYSFLGTIRVPYYDHPLQRAIIDNLGRVNLVLMIVILVCHEMARATARRHLYGMRSPSIPCTPHGIVVHVASYLWLFVGVWSYTVLPMLVVIFKHALNIRSTNYIVAEKKATREAEPSPAPPGDGGLPVSLSALGGAGGSGGALSGLGGAGGRRK
jgi:hypothetical protein